jgi:hypothetical protein
MCVRDIRLILHTRAEAHNSIMPSRSYKFKKWDTDCSVSPNTIDNNGIYKNWNTLKLSWSKTNIFPVVCILQHKNVCTKRMQNTSHTQSHRENQVFLILHVNNLRAPITNVYCLFIFINICTPNTDSKLNMRK